ncbi:MULTISPECIES: helix-turn-helix domain-containing protein [Vibrio]|uniref:Helix-turn-helix domain-containing protein n=1 Tax=Vibrio jasicida TaxID=766224 RepID=A0AAU9QHY2_9VIBR|nr:MULTISPECIES: helix-turn-helix transcriptional regulator [Vibrio]CAH1559211.1 Transcriptional regulator [Vibrio jasicida]PMO44111.1 transcriptional regulator [Vibrio sp. 10N.222.52.B12]UMM07016.1 helix-turn-helix domain-containing protein [Vibrio campbellii]CAH1536458.1 Transcriptional regulator [Vibrio owensii]CAH1570071.1 Transcriptional regulator [Vibrio jasicida]
MKDVNTLGGRLSEILFMKGMSAAELSRKVDIEAGYISKLLNNKIKKPHKNMRKIAESLDVSYEWLMTGKEISGVYEKVFDIESIVNNRFQKIGTYETDMPISKFEKIIYHDDSINIVTKRKFGGGLYLFEREGDIIELYREDNFLTMSWHPEAPQKTDSPIGKVISRINREHINDKKIEFIKN